jgi:hypothetical protein
MKKSLFKYFYTGIFAISITLPASVFSQQTTDIFSGHFAREGNNGSPAKTINSNIYIKLFKDQDQNLSQWVITLFVPYPYAATVEPAVIEKVFEQAKKQTTGSAYIRGTFGQLAEKATVQIERFGYMEDRIIFECGSMAPCTIKMADGYLELIKPGIINEHIIKYNHVADQ